MSYRRTPDKCETSKLFCIENLHDNLKDGLLNEIFRFFLRKIILCFKGVLDV